MSSASPRPAPTNWTGVLRQLGPGLILTSIIVGSGELIVTPKLGADVGFSLLWFIIFGCFIKVFVQVEFGRIAVATGMTTLEAMNTVPGPRLIVSWLLWLWLIMYAGLVFQVAGIIGATSSVFALAGVPLPGWAITVLLGSSTAVLLVVGRYRLIEGVSTALVGLFTISTLGAAALLQWTEYAVTPAQLAEGLSFRLPGSFAVAFAAFGVIGVGASELIYYPYWCIEKGYARSTGRAEDSDTWRQRYFGWLRVMQIDAWLSCAIYTVATISFYLLGAAVLHSKGLVVGDSEVIATLSQMYLETFGQGSFLLFLIGAFAVLYSTVFGATASNARLFADALALFGVVKKYPTPEARMRMVNVGCVLLPIAFCSVYLIAGTPVTLVLMGAMGQALMLPFLGGAALYFYYCRTDKKLKSGMVWAIALWISAIAMMIVGGYRLIEEITKRM